MPNGAAVTHPSLIFLPFHWEDHWRKKESQKAPLHPISAAGSRRPGFSQCGPWKKARSLFFYTIGPQESIKLGIVERSAFKGPIS